MVETRTDIPIPEGGGQTGRPAIYNWGEMPVGGSRLYEGWESTHRCRPYMSAKAWGIINGRKFKGRQVDGGVRIWRVE